MSIPAPVDSSLASSALRKARSVYSQRELAKLLDVVPRTIARWESGEVRISPRLIPALREIVAREPSAKYGRDFTFVDLFAGIGGIRRGFEAHGGTCVFTSEWDEFAKKTYRANFPDDTHEISGDITAVAAGDLPKGYDVLLAGFPCQPFSIAGVSKKNALGMPHGFECTTQGTLFFDVARLIAESRPKAFLLENVKNLVSHDGGNTFRVMCQVLEDELKYKLAFKVMDAQHFVPQHRERIIMIGFRQEVGFNKNLLNLPPKGNGPLLSAILHPEDGSEIDVDEGRYIDVKGKVQKKFRLTDNLWRYLQDYAAKHQAKGNGFGFGLVTKKDVSRTLSARYYKDGSEILVSRGGSRNPRRLTPRECARLMGYGDKFRIPVSDTRAYKQFGNSVVVPLMAHVAGLMKPYIMAIKEQEEAATPQTRLF